MVSTTLYPPEVITAQAGKKPFLNYIHNFRAIAILFIVAVHCNNHMFAPPAPASISPVSTALFERSTLLFVFIAGFLFQHLSYKFEIKGYWQRKFANVILPYFIISIPIIIFRVITENVPNDAYKAFSEFHELPALAQVAFYYLTGSHLAPFWFIPMIVLYYVLAPILVKLDREKHIYYFLPLFLIVSLLVPRGEPHQIHISFVHFFSVYLLGMFISRYREVMFSFTKKNLKLTTIMVVILFVATIFLFDSSFQAQLMFLQKISLAWLIMFALWKFDKFIPKKISLLADMSFGIFFIHYYFLLIMQTALHKTTGNLYLPDTDFYAILVFAATLGFCLLALFLVKKVLGEKSRYLIGY